MTQRWTGTRTTNPLSNEPPQNERRCGREGKQRNGALTAIYALVGNAHDIKNASRLYSMVKKRRRRKATWCGRSSRSIERGLMPSRRASIGAVIFKTARAAGSHNGNISCRRRDHG